MKLNRFVRAGSAGFSLKMSQKILSNFTFNFSGVQGNESSDFDQLVGAYHFGVFTNSHGGVCHPNDSYGRCTGTVNPLHQFLRFSMIFNHSDSTSFLNWQLKIRLTKSWLWTNALLPRKIILTSRKSLITSAMDFRNWLPSKMDRNDPGWNFNIVIILMFCHS